VTAHEFRRTAANKAFLILTILGPFLITAMGVLPTILSTSGGQRASEIAALGAPEPLYREVAAALEALKSVIGQALVARRLRAAGAESPSIRELIAIPEIGNQQVTKSGRKVRADVLSSILIGVTFTLMLYMTILLYGQSIGRSVVQEKTSRTLEIMLSSVEARDLPFLRLLAPVLRLQSLPQLSGALPFYLVLFFLLGFFLYSAIYAALGAAAEDEQNPGTLSWPVLIFLMVPMVGVGALAMSPASPIVVAMSLFPLTAPIVMFVRLMLSEPAAWQVALSVGPLLASILGIMGLSAKIFSAGILMIGRRFRRADIMRWLRA
jgi:ABC-2 type transport system permease protein